MPRARIGLILAGLIALNVLDYSDRNLLPGALPVMHRAMGFSDAQIGSLISAFFLAYMWGAPLLGWLGDRFSRPLLVLLSCFAWSLTFGLVTLTSSQETFRWTYAMSGIAMAGFGIFGIAMLSDFASHSNRSRMLSLFFLAMTTGRALGFPIGGWLAQLYGWKAPFQISSAAGLVLVCTLAFVFPLFPLSPADADRGTNPASEFRFDFGAMRKLCRASYLVPVFGLAMHTFTLSGLSVWLPMFLYREAHYSAASASTLLGAAALAGGLAGTWLGGVLGDRLSRRSAKALHWVSAAGLLLTVPCVAAILTRSPQGVVCGIFGMQFSLACALCPLNTALINAIPEAIRATGISTALLLVHALGDVPSPRLIGAISEHHGLPLGISITLASLTLGAAVLLLHAQTLASGRDEP